MRDKHVRILAVLMGLLSLPLLSMLLLSPLAAARVIAEGWSTMSSQDRVVFCIMMPFSFLLGVYGLCMALVARGLWKGQRWAGLWGTIISATWVPMGLMPFGIYGLYALLRSPVRSAWSRPAPAGQHRE